MIFGSMKIGVAALVLAMSVATVEAKDLQVYGGSQVSIEDGSLTPNPYNNTDFGNVSIGNAQFVEYWITAADADNINIGNVTVTGANAGDFTVFWPYGNTPMTEGAYYPIRVTFGPKATGLRTATISIETDVPGNESLFTFNIQGRGINGFPVATADVALEFYPNYAKGKANKKTGKTTVTWKVSVVNYGPVASDAETVSFYYSEDETLSLTGDQLLYSVPVKGLPAFVEGAKKQKRNKLKFKADLATDTGYVFAVVSLLPAFPTEAKQSNNVIESSYYVPVKK